MHYNYRKSRQGSTDKCCYQLEINFAGFFKRLQKSGGGDTRDECGDKAELSNLYLSICTGKCFLCKWLHYMQVLFEAYSISVQCLQTAPAGADFTTPKSKATAQLHTHASPFLPHRQLKHCDNNKPFARGLARIGKEKEAIS